MAALAKHTITPWSYSKPQHRTAPVSFSSFVTLVSNNNHRATSRNYTFSSPSAPPGPGKMPLFVAKNAILHLAKFLVRAHNNQIPMPPACSLDHQLAAHGDAAAQ
jgi:hypothetical protein